ncbi:hypothetical protein OHB26_38840 (plasmid) [Nocardia sp. NBC_01503]|uniref:hypothetical protein n=1 Tax=Nocardia sp. NBC_01503 TaxID=2975997 RepID=UPI002E7C0C37|nr:hypothetical protein [Nocardia sp. NBC_01503]WTL36636.1 hypothetical protein OHB26_38840 [Nocardia sp. NBC_01503]
MTTTTTSQDDPHAERPESPETGAAPGWRNWLGAPPPDTEPLPDSDPGTETTTAATVFVDDDPMAPITATMRERSQAARRRRLIKRSALAACSAAACGAVVVGGWLALSDGASSAGVAPAARPSTVTVAGTTPAAPWCAPTISPSLVIGNGPGDVTSATGVILLQQHAMYTLRDPALVRSVLAPDAMAASPEATRAAVDAIPAGTEYCVTITPVGPDHWNVQVAQRDPAAQWQQTVVTARGSDGRYLITSITAGGS